MRSLIKLNYVLSLAFIAALFSASAARACPDVPGVPLNAMPMYCHSENSELTYSLQRHVLSFGTPGDACYKEVSTATLEALNDGNTVQWTHELQPEEFQIEWGAGYETIVTVSKDGLVLHCVMPVPGGISVSN